MDATFRGHVEVASPGVITNVSVAPANEHDATVAPEVLEDGPERGCRTVLGDKGYWSPQLDIDLDDSIRLEAPSRQSDDSGWLPLLVGRRQRVESVISQLCQRYGRKQVYTLWPMASNEPMDAKGLQSDDRRHALPAGGALAAQLRRVDRGLKAHTLD